MKLAFRLFSIALSAAAFAVVTSSACAQDPPNEPLQTWTVVEQGQDVIVRLSYSGKLKGWDAAFGYDGVRLNTVNSAFIKVTDPDGKGLPPREDKLISRYVNMWKGEPFDVRVNLTGVYDMSTPGRYIVEWGCKKVHSQAVRIEVVKKMPKDRNAAAE